MRHAAPVLERRGRPALARFVSLKVVLFSGMALALVGVVILAASREGGVADPRAPTAPAVRPSLLAPRPALSADEQQYVETLWPIHTRIERAAVRLALGAAFYRLNDIDRAELKTRLDQGLTVFRDADESINTLAAPPALRRSHEGYLEAVRLFQSSAAEMLRMYEDGDEAHLSIGFPLSQQGSDKIREVGSQLFPDEYPPN
jgi:hypothetical protein